MNRFTTLIFFFNIFLHICSANAPIILTISVYRHKNQFSLFKLVIFASIYATYIATLCLLFGSINTMIVFLFFFILFNKSLLKEEDAYILPNLKRAKKKWAYASLIQLIYIQFTSETYSAIHTFLMDVEVN